MPEKLLSIKEVSEYLKLSEDEIKRLVDIGEIPAYRIGGTFLRFRREQINAIRNDITDIEEKEPEHAKAILDNKGKPTHPYTILENDIKRKEPVIRQFDYTFAEKIRDFFYFNDFYIISIILMGVLLYFIFKS